jgi:hypothetical protein
MGYDNKKLTLCGQSMAGPRKWIYTDTGGEAVSVYEGVGYFADAKQYGVKVNDCVEIQDMANTYVYSGNFITVQDTGGTTGTVVLDTGPDIPGNRVV